ncbi:hypothetical protein Dimus_024483 [Dionaea muscipula]
MGRWFGCIDFITLLFGLLLSATASSKKHGNPANDIVNIINRNRTAIYLPPLNNVPGLGCMALQYAEQCRGNCTRDNTVNCRLQEDDFTEILAPNCGVELPTFSTISGQIIGCQTKYLEPPEAFSHILIRDKKFLSLLENKSHSEVGVGLVRSSKGHFFWCILFSTGQRNNSFVLEDHGLGIRQNKGCYSGTNSSCDGALKMSCGAAVWSCSCFNVLASIILLHFIHSFG